MRILSFALAGALAVAAIVAAVAYAVPRDASVTGPGMPMAGMSSGAMMSGASTSANAKVTIRHVTKGCHVWSRGKTTGAAMRLHLNRGQRLSVVNLDFDAHQLVQLAGPAHLRLGEPMMMNHPLTISFPKVGLYRLGTKIVEMPGMMEVETIGRDNKLRLTVAVR